MMKSVGDVRGRRGEKGGETAIMLYEGGGDTGRARGTETRGMSAAISSRG